MGNLTALEHALGERLEVATADHEYTWHLDATLNHLEIVREVTSMLNELVGYLLSHRVVRGHSLGVLLEDVYQMRKLDRDGHSLHLSQGELGAHSLPASHLLLELLGGLLVCVDTAVEFATLSGHFDGVLALSHVLNDLALHERLTAAGAHDFQELHDVLHLLVELVRATLLPARRTPDGAAAFGAALAEEHLTALIRTFTAFVEDDGRAKLAEEMMSDAQRACRLEHVLGHHWC